MKNNVATPYHTAGRWPALFTKAALIASVFFLLIMPMYQNCIAQADTFPEKRARFEENITPIAEQFLGMHYQFGGNPEEDRAVDNSHLICTIYSQASKKAELNFNQYMPMKQLLENTHEIDRNALKNGDLVVLNNGLAALIYNLKTPDYFHLIYASFKRKEVISFNTDNVIYEAYWLKNLKGFYRLNENMLDPVDS